MNRIDTSLRDLKLKPLLLVLLYAGLFSILIGYLIGFIDYFLRTRINLGISFFPLFFFLSMYYMGDLVRKTYTVPHIVYVVIAGVFFAIEGIIGFTFPVVYQVISSYTDRIMIFNPAEYIFNIGLYLRFIISNFDFNYVLYILFIAVGIYVGVRRTY